MSEISSGITGTEPERNKSGNAFGHYRYFSYTRIAEWDEGKLKVPSAVNPFNGESLNAMFSWMSFFIPARLRKKDGFVDIEYQAVHLTNAMGELKSEVTLMKKDRQHMNELLDDVVNSAAKKKSK